MSGMLRRVVTSGVNVFDVDAADSACRADPVQLVRSGSRIA